MRRELATGAIAAIVTAGALVAINANDFAQEPATDTADVVATGAIVAGAAVWAVLRWVDAARSLRSVRAAAAGVAISAVVIGLASVVYDPFAS